MTSTDLARLQFAFTSINHFFFVPVTIGLAFLTALLQTVWYRNGRTEYRRLTRFLGTLLVINIAIGVVTGLVQEFEFGMNWGAYSRLVGNIFGRRWPWRAWAPSSWSPRSSGCGCSGGTSCRAGCTWRRSGRFRWAARCPRRSSWRPTPGCSTRSAT